MKIFQRKPNPRPAASEKMDPRLPSWPTYVNGHFVTFHEDGFVDIYSDGDVRLDEKDFRDIGLLLHRFVWTREHQA